jgi:hypothetical protein
MSILSKLAENFPVPAVDVSTYSPNQGSVYPMAGITSLRPNPQVKATFFDTDATGARRNLNIGQEQSPMKTPEMPQLPKKEGSWTRGYSSVLRKLAIDDSVKAPEFTDIAEFQKKLKPGDIILGKTETKGLNPYKWLIKAFTGYPWGHAALYAGEGRIVHQSKARHSWGEKVPESEATIRDHGLDVLAKGKYDLLAIRPDLSVKERKESLEKMRSLGHPSYSFEDFLRLGYFPWGKTEVNELVRKADKNEKLKKFVKSTTCSGSIALSYPQIDWRGEKSMLFVRPADFLTSDKTKTVAKFTAKTSEAIADLVLDKVSPSTRCITGTSGVVGFPGKELAPAMAAPEKPEVRGDTGAAIWR